MNSPKISFGEKVAFALGDFSNNSAYLFVGTFVISFLTIGMGLSGTAAGTIIALVTIFDAINDVIIGSMVDKAHARGTTYTKIMRFSIIPEAVLMVLLFFSPKFGVGAKVVYAFLIYAIYTIAQTAYQVPYGALSASMTEDTDDRIKLGAFRDWGANVGSLLINTFASVLILRFGGGEMNTHGFFMSALIIGIVLAIGGLIPTFFCKERVPVVASQEAPFKEGIKSFGHNRPAIVATIVICMVNCCLMARASFTAFYAPYYLGNPELIAPILSIMSIVPLVAILFIPTLTKLLSRRVMFAIAGICLILCGIVQAFAGGNLAVCIIGSIFCGLSLCFSITVTWGAIPDIADYGEYKTGVYCPSVCYAAITFMMKLATAIASYALGAILDGYGFEAGNVTENAVSGIHTWYILIPIILGLIALVAALFFDLTKNKLDEVQAELEKIHGEAN